MLRTTYTCNGARACYLPNSTLLLPYSVTPTIGSLTTSALAASLRICLLRSWRPLLFLLLSLVSLYSSNLQASVQRHLYEPVTIITLIVSLSSLVSFSFSLLKLALLLFLLRLIIALSFYLFFLLFILGFTLVILRLLLSIRIGDISRYSILLLSISSS